MSKNLCIIPARGGSKRIPRKNIRPFLGKPIIAYSIEAALESKLFDEVMVSTDDDEIAEVAKSYGATVPFIRSKENADDYATTVDVIMEVIGKYEENSKIFDTICCLYPTAPFVTAQKLDEAFSKLKKEFLTAVFPVIPFSYPIQRAIRIVDNKIKLFNPENENSRSQDLEKAFHDAGQFYFLESKPFLESKTIFSENTGAILMNELEVQDIDNETDWKISEIKYEFIQNSQ